MEEREFEEKSRDNGEKSSEGGKEKVGGEERQKPPQRSVVIRSSVGHRIFHVAGALFSLGLAIWIYIAQFYSPYGGRVSLRGCPSVCHEDSDCQVPDCGGENLRLECYKNRCSIPNSQGKVLVAAGVFFLGIIGLLWLVMAIFFLSMELRIDGRGIFYKNLFSRLEIPWDEFVGISYRGVRTKLGQQVTIYSLVGDGGIISFIKKGLSSGVTPYRELDFSTVLLMKPSERDCTELIRAVEYYSGQRAEPEHD